MKKTILVIISIAIFIILLAVFHLYIFNCKKHPSLTTITLRLPWTKQAQFAGYYIAKYQGYYVEEGLNVNIEEGGYASSNIRSVKENLEEFGIRSLSELIPYNNDLLILANIFKTNGILLVSKKEKNITNLKDLEGKKVAIWFIGYENLLKALLKKGGVDSKKVRIIPQKFGLSQFLNNEVDIITVMSYNELLELKRHAYPESKLNIIDFKDYSLNFLGDCIFTSKSFYTENPDICDSFTRASIKGWQFAVDNPEESIDILLRAINDKKLDYNEQLEQLQACLKLIEAGRYPIGHIEEQNIKIAFDTYKSLLFIEENIDYSNFYKNPVTTSKSEKNNEVF